MTKSRTVEVNVTQSTLVGQTAQATADSAAGGVASLNNPNLMGVIEKQRLAIQMDNFATIYAADKDIATSEGIDFTAYDAAYHAYLTYMTPLVSDMTTYSPIVRATFNSLVTAVQAEQKRFNAATQAQYNQQINKAKTDISDGQTKYKALQSEAETMKSSAADIADKANRLASQYDDTNSLASQAFEKASSAQIDASSAVYKAESTASEFGKVGQKADSAFANAMSAESNASSAVAAANSTASAFGPVSQKADSAFANAMSAQNVASSAVEQALSAAADSKDAKQIAGAVSQSYKTLTDGSTMTIAELQNGLGAKLTKTDLNGYATQDWSQNQIRMTANGINETISSIKGTVDSHTTSINDFQADSEKFKAQFTTVNGTLDKQSTDISTLQASSKELSSNFSSLTTDNNTNKNDISELKQTATKLSSTMETVQTQVQNSAVGANLIVQSELKSGYLDPSTGSVQSSSIDFNSDYIATNGATVFTFSSPDYVFKGNGADDRIAMYNSNKNYLGYQSLASPTQTLSNSNVAYIRFSINFTDEGGTTGNLSDWLANHRYKLEKGSIATDWCPNPEDTATVTAVSKLSQTVDGFKTDISKKIEQKDLNGYATQDWAQNQIKTTADGINGTISSIKGTVDSHTTSINDFQADSEKFKAQFTTYKDTVDKHDRDISTLQADSKSLSSNFDSLNTANGTNEHHISELQQTAKDFSSTLETVQTQVQNSAVGTNLLTNTSDLSANWSLTGIVDTSQKPAVLHYPTTTLTSSVNNIANQQLNDGLFQPSTTYTASFHAKGAGTFIFYCWPSVSGGGGDNLTNIKLTSDYKLYTITFTTNPDISGGKNFLLRQDYSSSDPDQNTVEAYVYGLKLEKGSLATDWCPNPADNATVTAVSKLSQTVDGFQTDISKKIEQKDLNGYATETWSNNQIKLTADGINGAISSVKNIVDDHTTSIHDIQADSKEFKSQFTTYKDTVDRHDTDISTLQRDSKSLSSNFDSLDSDNKTNQHNIGQLQQSAKEFNSTMETVQTQVQNSAVGTNLLSNSKGKFQPNVSRIDNYIVYSNTPAVSIYMTQGQQYTVHANASSGLVWSGTHNPSVESNNVVLWVVNGTSVNTIISDANTGTGTTFTWNNPSGTYYLRVNTYKSDNSGYVENVKIEKGSLATDWCANPADNATVTAVSKISQTVNGFQTTISDKVSSSQLTELSGQLTNQIKDLASKTDSSFRQTANDINGMVKKGDVVNQFNLDAGGALLSTSGNSTKIVFSSPNILFDSANPVQIPNANIPGKLTGKTFEAGTITATTKITGSDIEAPIIHSPSGSFKLDGKTGDIIGASIHSANNSWGIDKDGNINGVNIVANTFNTNNGTFQVDSNGVVTANNLIIRNLVYNASLLGGNGNTIPGWSISNNGYYASNMVHDGVPSIEWNNTTGAGVWTNFAQTKLYPLNGLAGLPFSASVWFLEMGSDTSLLYQVTLAFFDSNGNRINGGFVGNTWNGISSRQDWRYVTIDNAVAPSNAISVGLQYWAYNGKGSAAFSSPMLTQTAHSTGYQPDTGNIVSAGIIDSSVINTPTLNLGTNGTLTTDFDINQDTGLYAPKKGTGTLTIKTGVINSSSDNMSRYSNTEGYWYGFDDNGSMVKNGTNHTGDDYAPGYVKHDIMKSNGNVLNRSYMDAMGLMFNEGGTQTFNTLLTAVGLDTGSALLHKDLATNGTFEAALGTDGTYGFTIGSKVIAPMIQENQVTYSANIFISRNGYMALSTSTKANKLDIVDVPDMLQKGYNLLTINPRQWFDKTSVEAYADLQAGNTDSVESVVDIKPVSGLVAEEVASAGLDDYVTKDENNKVQGLAYDRLWTLLLPVLRDMNNRLNEAQLEITKLKRGCLK